MLPVCSPGRPRRRPAGLLAVVAALFLAWSAPAAAQTLQLTASNDTVIRGGTFANVNFGRDQLLATRSSSNAEYIRRVLLKFDTQNPIPQNTKIVSAILTVTVAGGNAEARSIKAHRITNSYEEAQATWNRRNSSTAWAKVGGDLGEQWAAATVTHHVGSRVSFDVTALVQAAVNGQFGSSRYTRIALADPGSGSSTSYKEYFSGQAADPSVRPTLTVTLGTTTAIAPAPAPAPEPTTTGVKLRVLMWNLHHGVGTDGKYNLDRIATWMAKMNPDVIVLNEVEKFTSWGNEDQPARYKAMLEAKTGKKWHSHFTQEFGNWNSNGKGHQILSIYPFDATGHGHITKSSGLKGAGAISQAAITVNGRMINILLTHLDPSDQAMRLVQAKDAIKFGLGFAENRLMTGDMNAWPDQTSIAEFNKTYNDSWTVAEKLGKATGVPGITPFGATKKGRIDYIFFSKLAPHLSVLDSMVYDTRDANGHMPSDHRPVVTTFLVK